MTNLPNWAERLVRVVARDVGREPPVVVWRHWRKPFSTSGVCYLEQDKIVITEGCRGNHDTKRVLLHELAHWITQQAHTETFYAVAFSLYARYAKRITMKSCREFEDSYKPRASAAGYARYRARRG